MNAALIGFGHFGKVHFKYLNKSKRINLKKICVRKNLNVRLNGKKIDIITTDKNLIINDKKIKFIDIVTPIKTHAEEVISYLKAGKKVLCEKPLILKVNEENKIINLLKRNKCSLKISYPYLFSKSLKKSKELINKKNFGSVEFIDIQIFQSGRFTNFDVFTLLGPHAISILSFFFNISEMKFKKIGYFKNKSICESGIINCFLKNKFVSNINLSTNYINNKKVKKILIHCTNGTIICDLEAKNKNVEATVYLREKEDTYYKAVISKTINYTFDEKNNIKYVIEDTFNKDYKKNFILTQNINKFIKQKIYYG